MTEPAITTPRVGDRFAFSKIIETRDVDEFARLTGDVNPLHMDPDYARQTSFRKRVVHGMLVAGITSRLVGMHVPGVGALWGEQHFQFRSPVFIGDRLDFSISVLQVSESTQSIRIRIEVVNDRGLTVLAGDGLVMMVETKEGNMSEKRCNVALVTGASRGIGRAIALRLATEGIAVGVNFRASEREAAELVGSIAEHGGKAVAVKADVRNPDEMRAAALRCADHFQSPVDALVCNAGADIVSKTFAELEWPDFETHWELQVRGAYNSVKAVLDPMLQQGFGKIIFINSTSAWSVPPGGWNHYTTAKYALAGFAKTLAVELGPRGVRVNTISPGMTETDLIATIPERLRKISASQVPLRRLAAPEDIANVAAFLAGPGSDYLNGVDIPVAGGSVMR